MKLAKTIRTKLFRKDLYPGIMRLLRRTLSRDAFTDQKKILKSTDVKVIFDVGANRGDVAAQYHQLFPMAEIHMFEPHPETYSTLQARFRNSSFAYLHELAVSAKTGMEQLFITQSSFQHSLLQASENQTYNTEYKPVTINVTTTTIDDYCLQHAINHINILKIDVQGSEYSSLVGAASLLKQSAIDLIYAEAFIIERYHSQPLLHDISSLLRGSGYYMFNTYNFVESNVGQLDQVDVIYTSPMIREALFNRYGEYNTQYSLAHREAW